MKVPIVAVIVVPCVNQFFQFKDFIIVDNESHDEILELCLHKISVFLKRFLKMPIDYPTDLDEFVNLHYNKLDTYNCLFYEIYDYGMFYNDEWITPWSSQEIYENVLTLIQQEDITNGLIRQEDYELNDDEKPIEDEEPIEYQKPLGIDDFN